MKKGSVSYRRIFRVVFVLFSLYLLRDAFFRWDGFSFYASFSEFLPSVALVTMLWTVAAGLTALLIWMPAVALQWINIRTGWKVKGDHWLLFLCIFLLLGLTAQAGKRFIWPDTHTPVFLKILLLAAIALTAVFITWVLRNSLHKTGRWMEIVQQRITPLVWLFGAWFVLSVLLVAWHMRANQPGTTAVQENLRPPAAGMKQPNIILLTFDTLTARDMSVYGYDRPTTPFISEWAKTASLFTMVQAESNFTTPTTASLMTGKRVWTHRTYHLLGSRPLGSDIESLPFLLKNNGYFNMAFVVNTAASVGALGVTGSFETAPLSTEFRINVTPRDFIDSRLYRLFGGKIRLYDWIIKEDFFMGKLVDMFSPAVFSTRVPPWKAFDAFRKALDKYPPKPFFAWIHVVPPHYPYLPPRPYMGMIDSSPGLRNFKSQENARVKIGIDKVFNKGLQPLVYTMRARYDEFIRYCDSQFKNFLGLLRERDLLKNTVIVFSSDHGESFEHNLLGHSGPHLYEQLTHIPLIIREPGQTEGRVISELVEQIDIPATILDLAGIPVPRWMEGRSLVPLMRGEKIPPRPAFSMNLETNRSRGGYPITRGTIAVWDGDYKLIYYLKKQKALLFNLREDPDELNNLFDREPETGRRLLALIKKNLKKANEKITGGE